MPSTSELVQTDSNSSFVPYIDLSLGISLQYPSNWSKVNSMSNQVTFAIPDQNYGFPQSLNNLSYHDDYMQISFTPSQNLSLEQFVNKTIFDYNFEPSPQNFKLKTITAFGFNGYVDRTLWYTIHDVPVRETFILNNDRFYRIRYNDVSDFWMPSVEKTFDSLRFVSPNSQDFNLNNSSRNVTYNQIERIVNPIAISRETTEGEGFYAYSPDIALSPEGILYTAWAGDNSSGDKNIFFTKSNDGGATFERPVILNNESINSDTISKLYLSENNVYVLWNDRPTLKKSIDGGNTFESVNLNLVDQLSQEDAAAADITDGVIALSGHNLYLALYSNDDDPAPIYFVKSIDGGKSFEKPIKLSNNETGYSSKTDPEIVLSDGENIHVVWYNGTSNEVLIRSSSNGGASFGDAQKPFEGTKCTIESGEPWDMNIAASGNNIYIACILQGYDTFQGDFFGTYDKTYMSIVFTRSNNFGASFDSPRVIYSKYGGSDTRMSMLAYDKDIFLTWGSDYDIYFQMSRDEGKSFGSPIDVSFDEIESLYPDLYISGNNIFIAWQQGDTNSDDIIDVMLISSSDGGDTFGKPARISSGEGHSIHPHIVAQKNNVYAAWINEVDQPSKMMFAGARLSPSTSIPP